MRTSKTICLFIFLTAWNAVAFPSFEPFTPAVSAGGTSYTAGAGLFHQTNALGEGWALWNGGSGSASAEVAVSGAGLSYSGFPAGFPAAPSAGANLPGNSVALAGYGAALQFSRAITADPRQQTVNKIFASFLMQVSNLGNLAAGSPIYFAGFATNLGDQNISLPSRALKLFLLGNGSTSTAYALGMQGASGNGNNATYDGGGHTTSSVLFVVVDYEFGINGGADAANLWVNPSSSTFAAASQPAATVSLSFASGSAYQLQSAADFYLLSRTGTTLWGALEVGDLRVGDTWAYATGAPEIVGPLTNQTNAIGSTAVFTVNAIAGATNVSPLGYTWQYNGAPLGNSGTISGANTASLTISGVNYTNAGTYAVTVSNSLASASSSAPLTVSGVAFLANPVSQFVVPGGSASFSVSAIGSLPLTYQWQKNGVNLTDGVSGSGTIFSGSHSNVLALSNISYADSGDVFDCVVTNGLSQTGTSATVSLTVGDPIFSVTPTNVSINTGGTAAFVASVVGSSPFSFQWTHGSAVVNNGVSATGSTISGAMTGSLTVSNVHYGDAGPYTLTAINAHGVSISATAFLTVVNTNTNGMAFLDYRNVTAYGAVGDGVTDSTAAFQAAINAAQANTNSGIYVPPGKYVISSGLNLGASEILGRFDGGWPAENIPLPTLLIRQTSAPAIALAEGASVHGIAIIYDQGSPSSTNNPALSLQGNGVTLDSIRIQNPYDGVNTLNNAQPGRARFSDILIENPVDLGVQISKCYDFVQYRNIEVICKGAPSLGPAFCWGRCDEGGYVGLVASNCAVGFQFYTDTAGSGDGGEFTGTLAGCSANNCGTGVLVTGNPKLKIDGGDFVCSNYGAVIQGTNTEAIFIGAKWLVNNYQAILASGSQNVLFEHNIFCRGALPAANPFVWIKNCTTATINFNQFLVGSTGVELDSGAGRAIVYGNSFADGGISNYTTAGFTTIGGNLFMSSAPSGLTATPGNNQIAVSWIAPLGATSYQLQRGGANGGPYTNLVTLSGTSFVDTSVVNGMTYYYVVVALRGSSQSAPSAQASATPELLSPTGLSALAGDGDVVLGWMPSVGATNYDVEESQISGGPYTIVASTTVTNAIITGLTDGTPYYFVVVAQNANGSSTNSLEVSATPTATVPAIPTGLIALPTNNEAILNWNAVPEATSYEVKRSLVNGGPYSVIAQTAYPQWTDLIVGDGTQYFYVVSALNAAGQSGNSAQVSVIPQLFPPLNTSFTGNSSLTLSWTGAASNYSLSMATNLDAPAIWLPVTNTVQSNNGVFSVTLSATNIGQQFYRLTAP